jgi:hypothetical protein
VNPTSWIEEECYLSGFQWGDPSKIKLDQVFELLDHWRQREDAGLTPLIWNRSCVLLADVELEPMHVPSWKRRQSDSSSDRDSEEEDFGPELGRISENNSEANHSPSSSSSPDPYRTQPEGLEDAVLGSPPFHTLSSIPDHSYKSDIMFPPFTSLTRCL